MNNSALCSTLLQLVYDFQIMLSGMLAIVAAIITAIIIWRAAKLPIEEEKRQALNHQNRLLNFHCRKLSDDLQLLAKRATQTEGTIKVQIASQKDISGRVRERTILKIPEEFSNPEIMSLFSQCLAKKIMNLQRLLNDHNLDMRKAGGAFGADNFQQSIFRRLESIKSRTQSLSGELESESKIYCQTE